MGAGFIVAKRRTPNSAPSAQAMTENVSQMRLLACFVAVVVYIWQEQREFSFPQIHFAAFILGVGVCPLACVCSCAARAASSRQNP
jgi:hypothetical protein